MIDINSIILDLDYIYVDVSSCEVAMVCLPVENDGNVINLPNFLKKILFETCRDLSENGDYVTNLLTYLNSGTVFSVSDFKALLVSLLNTQPKTNVSQSVVRSIDLSNTNEMKQQPVTNTIEQQSVSSARIIEKSQDQQGSYHIVNDEYSNTNGVSIPNAVNNPIYAESDFSATQVPKKKSLFYRLFHSDSEKKRKKQEEKELKKEQKKAKKDQNNTSKPIVLIPGPSVLGEEPAPNRQVNKSVPADKQSASVHNYQNQHESNVMSNMEGQQGYLQTNTQHSQNSQSNSGGAYKQQTNPVYGQPTDCCVPLNFGDTTVLNNGKIGDTTVLSGNTSIQLHPHLVRMSTNEVIDIIGPKFHIGRAGGYANYVISNSAVSKSHADIVCRGDEFFVKDTNSSNHTFVNGGQIQSGIEVKINHETRIRFADEEFIFKMY